MNLFLYLLQVTICLSAFYLFYHFVLRRETFFHTNRLYLLITLGVSFLLPLLRIYINNLLADTPILQAPLYVSSYLEDFGDGITITATPNSFPWMKLLGITYAAGIFVFTLRLVSSVRTIYRIRRNGEQIILGDHKCIVSNEIECPYSFFNTIFLPKDHTFTETELKEVICHEHAHSASGHSWDVLIMEIAGILLWPSPIIYLYRRALREVHEFTADAAVLKDTPWEAYAGMLIAQRRNSLQLQLSNQLIFSQLKKRLLMMNQKPSPAMKSWKYLGLVPILLTALLIFSFREKDQQNLEKEGQPEICISASSQYFIDGKMVSFSELETTLVSLKDLNEIRILVEQQGKVGMLTGPLLEIENKLHRYFTYVLCSTCAKGKSKGLIARTSPDISTGAINIPQGSVQIKSGDQNLKENIDFTIDYKSGHIKILNQAYLNGKIPIEVLFNGSLPAGADVEVFEAEEMPRFPGCENISDMQERSDCAMKQMFEFIQQNLQYPEIDKVNKVEGKVMAMFVIDTEGKMRDIFVKRSPSETMQAEVIRVMELMAATTTWIPAKNDGKPVNLLYTLPVAFSLGTAQEKATPKSDQAQAESEIMQYAEEMPRFPGCDDNSPGCTNSRLYKFIAENLQYPEADKEKEIEGTTIAQFVIETDGSISNVEIRRSASPAMSEEVVRIIEKMNSLPEKWTPGRHEGKPVRLQFTLPVKFVLQSDEPTLSRCENIENEDERQKCSNKKLVDLIFQNMKYLKADKNEDVENTGFIQFTISYKGELSVVEVKAPQSGSMKEEILKVFSRMNKEVKWNPATIDGRTVDYQFILPLRFNLDNENSRTTAEIKEHDHLENQTTVIAEKPNEKINIKPNVEIEVHPNPAYNIIGVDFKEGYEWLKVYDASGRELLSTKVEGLSKYDVDVSQYPVGKYTIQLVKDKKILTQAFAVVR